MTHDIDREHLELVVPTVPEQRQSRFGCSVLSYLVVALAVIVVGIAAPREAIDSPAASPVGLSSLGASELRGSQGLPWRASLDGAGQRIEWPRSPDAPTATGAIGTVLLGGYATWYATPGLTAAAGPLLRSVLGDWRGQLIEVQSGSRSVTVKLTDVCACGERHGLPTLLDLSDAAFAELGLLSAGVLRVSIEIDPERHPDDDRMRAEDAATLPPTDR